MARRRTLNYREMRADFDEDEERRDDEEGDEEDDDDDEEEEAGEAEPEAEGAEEGEEGEGEEEEAPVKKKKPKPKPKRTRAVKTVRERVVWGVYNNSHQLVATFDYPKRADAEAHVVKLMTDKKSTHFIQPVREKIEEKKEK